MKKLLAFLIIYMCCDVVHAQHAAFISSGKITFERKVNTFAAMQILLKETRQMPETQLATIMQQYRSANPQFWVDSFDLYFDKMHTLYEPANPDIEFSKTFPVQVAYKNKVYNNLETKETIAQKQIFENSFFIKDSIKNIRWKFTDETREIAGYECRRANALLFDSVYIVAFYTDEIITKGGPESFNGLPGMILGIAIPYEHITIFATKISGIDTSPQKWNIPIPGKRAPLNNKEFNATTKDMLKQYMLNSNWVLFFINL